MGIVYNTEKYTIACLSVHLVNELKQLYLIFLNCHVLYIVHYSRVGENIIDYIFLLLPTSNNDAVMGTIFFIFFYQGFGGSVLRPRRFLYFMFNCTVFHSFSRNENCVLVFFSLFRFRINVIRIRIQDFANLDPGADPNEN